ncbi:MAG: aspartyl protease family protein [Hyphomonadaceae bacterium]
MHRRAILAALAAAPFITTRGYAATLSTPLSADDRGRPLADVRINGAGPFSLVIDTAAGGTVLSARTIERLAIQPTGQRARIQGASGAMEVELYNLDRIEIAGHTRENVMAVPTPPDSASAAQHEGVLGMGVFANSRVEFDFAGGRLNIDTDPNRAPLANAISVELRNRIFARAPITIAGVNATAVIDTGARVTVANARLRDALGFAENDPRLREAESIGGATADRTPTRAGEVTPVLFAGHDFGALDLNFAELPVFRSMQLDDAPAVILGVDLLRRAQSLTLDYTSAEVALRV